MNEMCTRETAKYCVLDMRTGGEACLTSWSTNFQQFMEPNSSSPYSQKPTTVYILSRRFPNCAAEHFKILLFRSLYVYYCL